MRLGASIGPQADFEKDIQSLPESLDFIELPIGELERKIEDIDVNFLKSILDAEEYDIIVHLPFGQPAVTQIQEFNEAEIDYLSKVIEFAGELEAEKVVFHPNIRYREEGEDIRESFREQLDKLDRKSKTESIELCVENMPPQINCAANNSELAEILREKGISMCFDTGHGFASMGQEEMEEFLNKNSDVISHLHLQDTREGEDLHLPIGSANIDFKPIGEILSDFEGTATMEVFTDDMDYLRLSEEKVKEHFQQ